MIVTLDGNRVDADWSAGCCLRSVIDSVRAKRPDDRLVVSVSINGRRCSEEDLNHRLAKPLSQGDQVDLESGDRFTVAADALRGLADGLQESGQLHAEIARQVTAGNVVEAVQRIGDFIRIWQACCTAIVQCSGLVGRDLTRGQYQGRPTHEFLAELVEQLRELRSAFEARDLVLLVDLLHYEMPSLSETWSSLLKDLADGIEKDAPVGAGV